MNLLMMLPAPSLGRICSSGGAFFSEIVDQAFEVGGAEDDAPGRDIDEISSGSKGDCCLRPKSETPSSSTSMVVSCRRFPAPP